MNIARQAIKAWPKHEFASRQQINALRRGWMRAIEQLGPRWLLARDNFVQRKEPT